MSDTVTQALRRIAAAEGATYSPGDTDVILARRIYEVLSGSQSSKSTFTGISKDIATYLGASITDIDGAVTTWRRILEVRGGSSSQSTLLGLLYGVEDVGLSGGGEPEPVAPDTPANLTATAQSSSEILVEWDAVDGADSYLLQHSTDDATWSDESTISAPTVQYSDTGLDTASIHYYRIKAVTGELSSDYSSSVNATTQYDTNAQALFDLVEGTDGATYVAGAKDAINTMIAGIKADGNWSLIEQLWFVPGLDYDTSGESATLAALARKVKGSGTLTIDITSGYLHRYYIPNGAGAGLGYWGRVQEGAPDDLFNELNGGFTGIDGYVGALSWTGEQQNGSTGTYIGQTSGAVDSNTELRRYPDASNSSRVRMHGSGTEHKAYGDGTNGFGWQGGCRTGTLLENLRDSTVLFSINTGGAADASTAVNFKLGWDSAAGNLYHYVAFLSAPGATKTQALAIQSRINTAAQALGVPSSSTGATVVQCYGDSLVMGSSTYNARAFPEFLRDESGFDAWWQNLARSGAQTQTVNPVGTWRTDYGQYLDPDGSYFSGKVCFLLIGTNDLAASTSAATIWSNIQSFCLTMQTAGYSVVVMTVPPRDDASWDGTKETARGTLNTSIRAGEGTDYDVLFDLDDWISNTLGGSGVTPSNTTYYQADKLHFTDAMYQAMASAIAADSAISALF